MAAERIFPSSPSGGEGRAATAAKGEAGVLLSAPSPRSCFAQVDPLPLKGVRGFGVSSQGNQDCSQDSVQIAHHVRVGEADHSVAACFQRSSASSVVMGAIPMRVAVELDDQAFAAAGEVGDIGGKDHLPLELYAEAASAEVVPEAAFGFGEIFPEFLGAVPGLDVPFHPPPSPRSAARSRPLPLKGARGSGRHLLNSIHGSFPVNA